MTVSEDSARLAKVRKKNEVKESFTFPTFRALCTFILIDTLILYTAQIWNERLFPLLKVVKKKKINTGPYKSPREKKFNFKPPYPPFLPSILHQFLRNLILLVSYLINHLS